MPSGRAHRVITCALGAASLPLALLEPRLLAASLGILTGLIIDPDLDVDGWTEAEHLLRRRWRPLGWAWFLFWLPYARLASHRGYSHTPIVGTLGRAAYVFLPVLLVAWALGLQLPLWGIGLWLAGLCLADLAHIVADRGWTALRRRWRRVWK